MVSPWPATASTTPQPKAAFCLPIQPIVIRCHDRQWSCLAQPSPPPSPFARLCLACWPRQPRAQRQCQECVEAGLGLIAAASRRRSDMGRSELTSRSAHLHHAHHHFTNHSLYCKRRSIRDGASAWRGARSYYTVHSLPAQSRQIPTRVKFSQPRSIWYTPPINKATAFALVYRLHGHVDCSDHGPCALEVEQSKHLVGPVLRSSVDITRTIWHCADLARGH